MAKTKSKPVMRPGRRGPLVFVHIGDLHMTALQEGADPILLERERQLRADLDLILGQVAAAHAGFAIDFVYLPGDLAEDGQAAQYAEISTILGRHRPRLPPIHLIAGDHDRQHGVMRDFEAFFRSEMPGEPVEEYEPEVRECPSDAPRPPISQFYYTKEHRGILCIFLDLVSAGVGRKGFGLHFVLGTDQLDWLRDRIRTARKSSQPVAVFMHAYPDDFRERDEGSHVAGMFWNAGVRLVEMGHTHYNEIAHDGRTMYAAARSVGQNEDGPAGFAVVACDQGVVSWRFKQIQQTWPFVIITSPADRRLATAPLPDADGRVTVRAVVLSGTHAPARHDCWCQVDNGVPEKMKFRPEEGVFERDMPWPAGSRIVRVTASHGPIEGADTFDFDIVEPDSAFEPKPLPPKPGSPHLAVSEWLKKGVRGDQLGPNQGGRKW